MGEEVGLVWGLWISQTSCYTAFLIPWLPEPVADGVWQKKKERKQVFPHKGMAHGKPVLESEKVTPASICEMMHWHRLWQISSQTLHVVQWEFLRNIVFNKLASSMRLRSSQELPHQLQNRGLCRVPQACICHRFCFLYHSHHTPGCMHVGKACSGATWSICGK